MSVTPQDRRPGLLQRLLGRTEPAEEPPPAPPLFPLRPVPPPEPGFGLPAWNEILSTAPPVPEPVLRPTVMPDAPVRAAPRKRPPSETEKQVLARIAGLLAASQPDRAAALLDATFRDRPEVCDADGRPLYLMESLHCALLLGEADAAADRARRLRPHLRADDPAIEVLYARAAVAAGDDAAARTNWTAALARAPDLAEAKTWLAAQAGSRDDGIPAFELLGSHGAELAGWIMAPPTLIPTPAAAPALPDWLPGRLLRDAALSVDAEGGVTVAAADGSARPVPGAAATDLALVFQHAQGLEQPHVFGEMLLAAFVLHRQYLAHLRPMRIHVGRQSWARGPAKAEAMAAEQAEMLAVLFPGIRVIGEHAGPLREAQVLVVDSALRNAATGTMLGGMMPQVGQWAGEVRARAHAACALPEASDPPRMPGRKQRMLYVHGTAPQMLAEPLRERLFTLFAAAGFEVAMADVGKIPWHRQVRLAYGADLIAGVHGPLMDMLFWAHPQTRVLEFFPEGSRHYDDILLAEAAGLVYLGVEGRESGGFVVRARERWGPPVGVPNRAVWALPWAMLEQALGVAKPAG